MRSLTPRKTTQQEQGFTLVEMLVVAPIAILSIAAIVSLAISMVGDAMISQARATTTYDTQDSLDRIEQDIRLSSAFMDTFSSLPAGQGLNAKPAYNAIPANTTDTTAFTASNNTLILNQTATTSNPFDPNRDIVYYTNQPNACGAANTYLNRSLSTKAIYFLRDDGSGSNKILWRRTVVPDWNTNTGASVTANSVCNAPWQRDTCPTLSSADCKAIDEKMMENVSSFTITYYTSTGAVAANARSATSAKAVLTTSKQVAGSTVSTSGTLRATRTNDTLDAIPAAPVVSVLNPSLNTDNNPIKLTFGWATVPYAGYYKVRTSNTSCTSPAWGATTTTTDIKYVMNGKPLDVFCIGVIAVNDMGQSSETTFSASIPLWTVANLENNWTSWGTDTSTGHTQAAYTITRGGAVLIKGMMKKVTTVPNEDVLFTLPPGLRPSARIVFGVKASSITDVGRLDINTAGKVMLLNVPDASNWVTIDGTMFIATGYSSWTSLTPGSGFANLGGEYSNLGYYTDSTTGKISVQGLISGTGTGAITSSLPSIGSLKSHVRTIGALGWNENTYGINQTGTSISKRKTPDVWHSLQYTYYPNQDTGWTNLPLGLYWAPYPTAGWATPGYKKGADGIVSLKGLIQKSTASNSNPIFNLPAGFRPKQTWFVPIYTGCSATGILYIAPNGDAYGWSTSVNSGCTSLDNIHFMAEQ